MILWREQTWLVEPPGLRTGPGDNIVSEYKTAVGIYSKDCANPFGYTPFYQAVETGSVCQGCGGIEFVRLP
jgi:hypothetical protein